MRAKDGFICIFELDIIVLIIVLIVVVIDIVRTFVVDFFA